MSQVGERVDREQIRRDAEELLKHVGPDTVLFHCRIGRLAESSLTLLAELEQAERDRDDATSELAAELADARTEANILEARLAKVSALVGAAANAKSWIENYPLNAGLQFEADWAALSAELAASLTAWEAE